MCVCGVRGRDGLEERLSFSLLTLPWFFPPHQKRREFHIAWPVSYTPNKVVISKGDLLLFSLLSNSSITVVWHFTVLSSFSDFFHVFLVVTILLYFRPVPQRVSL